MAYLSLEHEDRIRREAEARVKADIQTIRSQPRGRWRGR
jgi:hypothetical protein